MAVALVECEGCRRSSGHHVLVWVPSMEDPDMFFNLRQRGEGLKNERGSVIGHGG